MKLAVMIVISLALILGVIAAQGHTNKCATGTVKGFAQVRGDQRLGGPGAIPNVFSADPRFFGIRYNCARKGVLVKRIDTGVYDVLFPENSSAIVLATAGEGLLAGVVQFDHGYYRVIIRSPLVRNDILVPIESPFYIAIF